METGNSNTSTSAEFTPISPIKPNYPSLSKHLGEEGTVNFLLWLRPDGTVQRADISQSSGFIRLDNAALRAVQLAKFHPSNSAQVAALVSKPFKVAFRLEN